MSENGEIAASVHYSDHDLREMFSRENAERRRTGGKMLRKYLTAKQDKQLINRMVRIREEFDVANNDDVIIVWVQQQLEADAGEGIDERLVAVAKAVTIPARIEPVYKE